MTRKTSALFTLFVGYVLAAGCWWSYLLYIKNRDAWDAKKEVLRYEMESKGVFDLDALRQSAPYQELERKYSRQEWMIFGEGAALVLLMLLGVWQIQRSRRKEWALAQQQQNFLLSITHELKSPLASIQLSLQTFLRHELPQEKIQRISSHALGEAQRLHRHIEIMLMAARMEGGYQYEFENVDAVALCQVCIQQVQPRYKGNISFDYPQNQACIISADKFTLTMALSNLLENAVAYAPDSQEIKVQLSQSNKFWLLSVADQGPGIPQRERLRIFEKFYRIGNENTRSSKGTGLGLYIVRRCAVAHKGHVTVSENQPQGAIFTLALPTSIP